MRLVSIFAKHEPDSLEPIILLDVVVAYQRNQRIPLDLAVEVRSDDRRLLGIARLRELKDKLSLEAYDSGWSNGETQVTMQAALWLTARQVDHLEALRGIQRKGDVVLHCQVSIPFLVSKASLAHLRPMGEKSSGDLRAVGFKQHSSRDPFHSEHTNMWLLSGDGGRIFLERETLRYEQAVTISSGDWLHDYAGVWNNHRYMVLALPVPHLATSVPSTQLRINTAIEAARRVEDAMAKGEWTEAMEKLRPVWELLRGDAAIPTLLAQDGYTAEAVTAFMETIRHQFDLSSKFIHRTDRSGQRINPEMRATKEDALVCFGLAMTLLNLVSRKSARQPASSP